MDFRRVALVDFKEEWDDDAFQVFLQRFEYAERDAPGLNYATVITIGDIDEDDDMKGLHEGLVKVINDALEEKCTFLILEEH